MGYIARFGLSVRNTLQYNIRLFNNDKYALLRVITSTQCVVVRC